MEAPGLHEYEKGADPEKEADLEKEVEVRVGEGGVTRWTVESITRKNLILQKASGL
jgi:hypothetical protein